MEKLIKHNLFLITIALALGGYVPFIRDSFINPLTFLIILYIILNLFTNNISDLIFRNKNIVLPWFIISIIFLISSIIYDINSLDSINSFLELNILVIFFSFLVNHFRFRKKLVHQILFVYGCVTLIYLIYVYFFDFNNALMFNNGRVWVYGENPNSTSVRLGIALILLIYLPFTIPKYSKFKFLAFISTPVLLFGIVQSGSRGSLLAVALSFLALIFIIDLKRRTKLGLLIFLVLILNVGYNFLSDQIDLINRFTSFLSSGDLGGRSEIWKYAIEISTINPFIGVGEMGYKVEIIERIGYYLDTHNLFLYILVCGGVLSLFLCFIFLTNILLKVVKSLKNKSALSFILFVFVMLIALKTGGAISYTLLWFIFAIIYAYENKEPVIPNKFVLVKNQK